MISRIDFSNQAYSFSELKKNLPRPQVDVNQATSVVEPIVERVKSEGAQALKFYAEKFDHVIPRTFLVPEQVLKTSLESLSPELRESLEESITRLQQVHLAQVPQDFTVEVATGARVSQRWIPVRRVGLYVPGGLAVYPSSVIMNVVAAKSAGVQSLVVVSPPQRESRDGYPHPTILAACELLGVKEVYAVGGAQAVAMLAYGVSDLDGDGIDFESVDVITGPGNVFVATAKRLVRGAVGIDAEAGPTEIAILADDSADPRHIAADLISQAEHDPLAASVLVTDSSELISAVSNELEIQVKTTKHQERVRTALGGQQSALILVRDLFQGIDIVNAYGAEHLEIQTREPQSVASKITSAGAIFVGPYSPVPLGDYMAGSNHVLPTGGCAHYASGLGVHSYLKAVQVIEYSKAALREIENKIVSFANSEDLPAHGSAIQVRFNDDK